MNGQRTYDEPHKPRAVRAAKMATTHCNSSNHHRELGTFAMSHEVKKVLTGVSRMMALVLQNYRIAAQPQLPGLVTEIYFAFRVCLESEFGG